MKRFFFWSGLLLIFVPIGLWLVYEPGRVTLVWFGYRVQAHAFIFSMLILWLMASMVLVTRLWFWLSHAHQHRRAKREQKQTTRSLQALTRGFVALAAGESRDAEREADTIDKNKPLPALALLLRAQAALQEGRRQQASIHFAKMLETPETAFLARRGLAQYALQQGHVQRAIEHLKEAHQLQPDALWPIKALFTAYSRNELWHDAEQLLTSRSGKKAFSSQQKQRNLAVIEWKKAQHALAESPPSSTTAYHALQKSLKYHPALLPAVLLKAQMEKQESKRKKALATLTHAWSQLKHPHILEACSALIPSNMPEKYYQTVHKMCESHLDDPHHRLALTGAAIKAQWWAQAQEWLAPLLKNPIVWQEACLYHAQIDQAQGNADAADHWKHKAEQAPPLAHWVCAHCQTPQHEWHEHCSHCQNFATLEWQRPNASFKTDEPLKEAQPLYTTPIDSNDTSAAFQKTARTSFTSEI